MKKSSKIVILFFLSLNCFGQTYKIGVTEWIGYSVLSVAEVKGFWKELGLDVQVVFFNSGFDLNTALIKEEIDISCGMLGNIFLRNYKDEDYNIIFHTNWSHGGDKIILKRGKNLLKLKNKHIGVYSSSPAVTFFLDSFFKENKMNYSDFKIISKPSSRILKDFIANKFDLILNYDPNALLAISEGNGKLLATTRDFPGVIPEGWFTKKGWINKTPKQDILRLYIGWVNALKWSENREHSVEFLTIINTHTFPSRKHIHYRVVKMMLEGIRFHQKDLIEENTTQLFTYLKQLKQFLKRTNQLQNDFSPQKIIRTENVVELKPIL